MHHEPNPDQLRDLAVSIAQDAGALLLARRHDDLQIDTKSTPTDLVTAMDGAAERLIVSRLHEIRPDDAILAEESGARPGNAAKSNVRWIVDPLDGTVNYAYGIPAWGVSIGAEVGGEIVAGAVFSGLDGTMFEAVRGGGARRNGEPLAATDVNSLALSLVATGFAYSSARREVQGAAVGKLLPQVRDIRRMGAASLDLCAVAAGTVDGYYEFGLQPWDRAAGMLIATEAGALVTTFPYADGDITVAAAPGVFDPLLARIRNLYELG